MMMMRKMNSNRFLEIILAKIKKNRKIIRNWFQIKKKKALHNQKCQKICLKVHFILKAFLLLQVLVLMEKIMSKLTDQTQWNKKVLMDSMYF